MARARISNSRRNSDSATLKIDLGVVLCLGFVLQISVPACGNVMPELDATTQTQLDEQGIPALSLHPSFRYSSLDRVRTAVMRDRNKEHAMYARSSGGAERRGAIRTSRELTSIPVGMSDPAFPEYLMEFKIGTPPRPFRGIADTGSNLVWVACDPCVNCTPRPLFESSASTSYKSVACSSTACKYWNSTVRPESCPRSGICPYNITYLTGGTTGDLSSDVLTLTNRSGQSESFPNFVFGCAHTTSPLTPYPIVGLMQQNLSLVGQLGPKVGNTLAFCFGSYFEMNVTDLSIGSKAKENLTFTRLVPSKEGFYLTNFTGIGVDGTLLQIPSEELKIQANGSGALILDTGTSYTILLPEVYSSLRSAMNSRVSYPSVVSPVPAFDLCYDVTNEVANENVTTLEELHLPNITFHFPNLLLRLPPDNSYLPILVNNATLLVCLAIRPSDFNLTIFGNFQMQNYYFFIDPDNERVGAKRGCQ